MLAVAFDTLKLARKLEGAGMQPKQAQDTSAALSESFTEWLSIGNVATREDVQGVKADVQGVRAELHEVKAELKADVQAVRAELHEVKGALEVKIEATKFEILKWMLAQTIALIGVLFGLLHSVVKF